MEFKQLQQELDIALVQLKSLEANIEKLTKKKEEWRDVALNLLKENDIKNYKNDVASVTWVERKTIKMTDKENVIQTLINKGLENFLDIVPAVAEHYELNKDFDDRVKKGLLVLEGVEVETKELPMIKLNK